MILEMKGVQLEGLDEEKKQRRERENTNQSESNQHLKSHQIHNSSHERHDAEHTGRTYKSSKTTSVTNVNLISLILLKLTLSYNSFRPYVTHAKYSTLLLAYRPRRTLKKTRPEPTPEPTYMTRSSPTLNAGKTRIVHNALKPTGATNQQNSL